MDDGSTDRTVAVAQAEATLTFPLRVVRLGKNQGKGAAVKRGVAEANGECIAFVDADLPYGSDAFDLAMKRFATGADLVIGGRDLAGGGTTVGSTWTRRVARRTYSRLANALAVRNIPDTQCGFKCFRAGVATPLFERVTLHGFAFDVEVLVLAQRWGLRIERIPVKLTHSFGSTVRTVRDSLGMFRDLLKIYRRRCRGAYDRPPSQH